MPKRTESGGTCPRALPPLSLRAAYTQKGLGIGAGGLVGHLVAGPYGAMAGALVGWLVGNKVASHAEDDFVGRP